MRVSAPVASAALRLLSATGMDEPATVAMLDSMAVLAESSPERLASALEAWAKRVRELRSSGGSSQVALTHKVHRGSTAGLEVTWTLKF